MDEEGAENGKLAKENTDTKGGTARNEDVPGKVFNCEATGGEVKVVKRAGTQQRLMAEMPR